jgi:hypothetical protein
VTMYYYFLESDASHELRCVILLVYTALKQLPGAVQIARNEQPCHDVQSSWHCCLRGIACRIPRQGIASNPYSHLTNHGM